MEVAETPQGGLAANPPLTRGLYAAVEVGGEIPEEYYQAVAEVLVFVYNKAGRKL